MKCQERRSPKTISQTCTRQRDDYTTPEERTGAPERPGCRLSRLRAVSITTRSHSIEPASFGVDDYQDFVVPPI